MKVFLSIMLMLSVLGCAHAPNVVMQKKDIVFPDGHGTTAMVKYIGELDIKHVKKSNFIDHLLGESVSEFAIEKPYCISVYGDRTYVTDTGSRQVIVFDKSKGKVFAIESNVLGNPVCVAAIAGGLYIADAKSGSVFLFDEKNNLVSQIKDPEMKSPAGLAVHKDKLYVVDSQGHSIFVFDTRSKERIEKIGGRGNIDGYFNFPSGVALSSSGDIYITDTGNFRIQAFDIEGKSLYQWGQVGSGAADLPRPRGVAIDNSGNVYVSDANHSVVKVFSKSGDFLYAIGDMGAGKGQFALPAGLAIHEGKLYVVDSLNKRVQIFQLLNQ